MTHSDEEQPTHPHDDGPRDAEQAASGPVADGELTEDGVEPPVETDVEEGDEPESDIDRLTRELAERTLDLQRTQAEFVNYKRRVERDREQLKENATFTALSPIVEVLDNIDRAREHGPLEGGFKSVAEHLERVVAGQGLTAFGEVGDAFDPSLHDALGQQGTDENVAVTTCVVIAKRGYKIKDRVVRAAQVLVVEPGSSDESDQTV